MMSRFNLLLLRLKMKYYNNKKMFYHPQYYLVLYSILSVQLLSKCKPSLLQKTIFGLKLKYN
jgi:hypothetical protein